MENEIVNIFSNLGFPVAVCVILFYIVFKQNKDIRIAIDNNTKALIELSLIIKSKK